MRARKAVGGVAAFRRDRAGQAYRESCAFPGCTCDLDRASVLLDERANDGQAETAARGSCRRRAAAETRFEDAPDLGWFDSRSVVTDGEDQLSLTPMANDGDVAARLRIANRVEHYVLDDLSDAHGVGEKRVAGGVRDVAALDRKADSAVLRGRLHGSRFVGDQAADVDRSQFARRLLDSVEPQIADQYVELIER